jgi:hypothetical protein
MGKGDKLTLGMGDPRVTCHRQRVLFVAPTPEGGYRFGSDRGSPNQGSTLLSKRVIAQIRSPVRVMT